MVLPFSKGVISLFIEMNIMITSGVYKIICLANSRFYIGGSVDISRRWREHKLMLNKGIHHTKRLQASWNKYGEKSFIFEVVEETSEQMVEEREKFWIEQTNASNRLIGFNDKYKSREGTWMCESRCKKYIVIHPNGKEEVILNMRLFARANNLNQGAMIAIANYKSNIHHGFHCRFAHESFDTWSTNRKKFVDNNKKNKAPMSTKNVSGYLIVDPSGKEHQVTSLTVFCKQHNLSQGNMTEVAKGRRSQHKGYRCSYLNSTK